MGQIVVVGLDIAKSVFQVHGVDRDGGVVVRRRLRRSRVLPFFATVEPLSRPRSFPLDLRHREIAAQGDVWPEAAQRVVTDGISPEQAVDEAIARIKETVSE